jgi:hypothetical protein
VEYVTKRKNKSDRLKELIKKEAELLDQFVNLENQTNIIFKTKKQIIQEWAKVLGEQNDLGYFRYPKHTICNYICQVVKENGYGMSSSWIMECLDTEYKNPESSMSGAMGAQARYSKTVWNESESNPIVNPDVPTKMPTFIEHNVPLSQLTKEELINAGLSLREIQKKVEKDVKAYKKHCEFFNIKLPEEDKPDVISTEKPNSKQTVIWKSLTKFHKKLETFTDSVEELANKTYEYPPTEYDDKFQEEIAEVIDKFSDELVDPLTEFIQPLKDEKWTQSWIKWWRTQILNINHGKHAAGTMSAEKSHKGERRGLTREQTGDRAEKSYEVAIKMTRAIPILMHLCDIHSKFVQPRILDRKIKMHDKLSDSA